VGYTSDICKVGGAGVGVAEATARRFADNSAADEMLIKPRMMLTALARIIAGPNFSDFNILASACEDHPHPEEPGTGPPRIRAQP